VTLPQDDVAVFGKFELLHKPRAYLCHNRSLRT
jgi:hypothetical protein